MAFDEARQAHARLSFLADLSSQLHGAHTRTELYERLSQAVTTTMADWSTVVVPSGDELDSGGRLSSRPRPQQPGPTPRRRLPPPLHRTFARRRGLSERPTAATDASWPHTSSTISMTACPARPTAGRLQLLGDGPGLIMPILSDQGVVAVLTMVRRGGELFSDEDVATMDEVTAKRGRTAGGRLQLETQRETASALQAAALPKTLPSRTALHLAAGYRAASEGAQVGGDWYDAFELQSGHIALVVGDAAGHGLQAAALMTQMRNALRAHLFESLGPSESIAKLSSFVATQEPDAFATIICVEIDPLSGEGVWASSGHPAPILLSRDGTSRYLQGKPGPPIGC